MLHQLAIKLDQAAANAASIEQLSLTQQISLDDAYEIQKLSIAQRLKRGEKLLGYKMGFTSRAKMEQMGVEDLIWGRLTDAMLINDGDSIDLSQYVHPRAEPEIAFKLKSPLSGKVSVEQALAAVEAIAPAIEVIDSRYQNFKFSLSDVICDNCSSTGFVIGAWSAPETDISALMMKLMVNNEVAVSGLSSEILDHPINSLVEAARCISESGGQLEAGQIILAGAATAAIALSADQQISVEVENLGGCGFSTSSSTPSTPSTPSTTTGQQG